MPISNFCHSFSCTLIESSLFSRRGVPVPHHAPPQPNPFPSLQVARKLKDLPHVIGYGAMNEPNMAWIGLDDLHAYKWALQLGPCCTPFQSLSLGNGLPVSVNHYDHGLLGFKNTGSHVLNPKGVRAYKVCAVPRPHAECVPIPPPHARRSKVPGWYLLATCTIVYCTGHRGALSAQPLPGPGRYPLWCYAALVEECTHAADLAHLETCVCPARLSVWRTREGAARIVEDVQRMRGGCGADFS